METTNYRLATGLQERFPHTMAALSWLVPAMEDMHNKVGKKTWLGKDRGIEAYEKFKKHLKAALVAMILDGIIDEATQTQKVIDALARYVAAFAEAYPNWQFAYRFAAAFLGDDELANTTALIQKLR